MTEQKPQATKVTLADINAQINQCYYFTAYEGVVGHAEEMQLDATDAHETLKLLTICVIVMRNGFKVLGTSACVDPATFDKVAGEGYARASAVSQIWPLLGYALADRLATEALPCDEKTTVAEMRDRARQEIGEWAASK